MTQKDRTYRQSPDDDCFVLGAGDQNGFSVEESEVEAGDGIFVSSELCDRFPALK